MEFTIHPKKWGKYPDLGRRFLDRKVKLPLSIFSISGSFSCGKSQSLQTEKQDRRMSKSITLEIVEKP